mgnify:CR=1 FL=1
MIPRDNDARPERAAMFVDYENLYSVLTSQSSKTARTSTYATEILDEVRRYLEEGDDTPTIYGRAFGPFDVLLDTDDADVPSALHREGIQPTYVPAAMQGNTSEIRLTIDVTRFLSERPDVQTIVIVTGDRPYLPLVRTIREEGRRALVAAVNPPQTEAYAENEVYLDARNLLSQDSREDLLANAPREQGKQHQTTNSATPQRYQSLDNPIARETIEITEKHFGQYDEVYLTPLLRKLSDVLGPNHDPKALVSELEAAGAVRLEKRDGYPYDYTVLIVNEDHPDVEAIRADTSFSGSYEGTGSSRGNGSTSYTESVEENANGDDMRDRTTENPDYDEYAIDEAISSDADEPSPDESIASEHSTDEPDDADAEDTQ